jgi:hypothetical protein
VTTPGSTTASRLSGSISRMRSIPVSTSWMPPSWPFAAPVRPEPAPRGTTGTRCSAATRSTAATSSADRGTATARGWPAEANIAWSRAYEETMSGSSSTAPAGSTARSAVTTGSGAPMRSP